MVSDVGGNATDLERATLRTVSRRLLPFLFILYIVAFLDRVNVGFAALEMNRDLRQSPEVYGFGAGIFFIGYALFEIPSNLILARTGARIWIARIMITWGIIAAAMMLVRGPLSFYVLRFLLGVAEAGFFPLAPALRTCQMVCRDSPFPADRPATSWSGWNHAT